MKKIFCVNFWAEEMMTFSYNVVYILHDAWYIYNYTSLQEHQKFRTETEIYHRFLTYWGQWEEFFYISEILASILKISI